MRLRIRFAKQGALRYTGHLDLHKIWERTARRADLPLAYSQGFHPQPKIYLASALPLGFSSRCELLDMKLKNDVPMDGLRERIQNAVPSGLQIIDVQQVDDLLPALQTQLTSAEYEVAFVDPVDPDWLRERVAAVLATESLPRERRGKAYNLRPLIEELTLTLPPSPLSEDAPLLIMKLTAREGATGRPEEVLDQLGVRVESTRIERSRLIFEDSPVK